MKKAEERCIICTDSQLTAIRIASRLELSPDMICNVRITKGNPRLKGDESFYVHGVTLAKHIEQLRWLAQGIEWARNHDNDLVPSITKWQPETWAV